MILDAGRMDAYEKALRQAIHADSVVLDIGTGTGIFALLACRLGARRVFAIDPSDATFIAGEIASANGYGDRIQFFQAASTEVALPEPADVLGSDLRGILPLFQHHVASLVDARTRLLKPDAVIIPCSDTLWACAVEAPDLHARVRTPWTENSYGFDMAAARRLIANAYSRSTFGAGQVLTEHVRCGVLDYRHIEHADFACRISLPVVRAGTGHGLAVWFDSRLIEGVELSNAPGKPNLIYGNAYFPWPDAVALEPGDVIDLDLRADLSGDEYIWSWRSRIDHGESGPVKARFDQSEFLGEAFSPQRLRKQAASHVPALSEEGQVARLVLDRMHEGKALAEIARELAARYPARFDGWRDALTSVGELSVRYSR